MAQITGTIQVACDSEQQAQQILDAWAADPSVTQIAQDGLTVSCSYSAVQ